MLKDRLKRAEPIPEQALTRIKTLFETGDLFRYHADQNSEVSLLEQEFAQLLGAKFALAVSSCSAALFLALKSLGFGAGERILIPAFTFAAVPSAVVHAGCQPVLVEVGANYRLDMTDLDKKLDDSIAGILVSHMRGHTSDMDHLVRVAAQKNIPLIEDAAHSLGTTWNGQNIGTIGKIGCFSFQSYKLLNGGEGGILVTDDEEIIAQTVIMSGAYENNWQKHTSQTDLFAQNQNKLPLYNTRMSNLSAAVIRPQLAMIERRAAEGLRNHNHLAEILSASPYISVPAPLPKERRAPDSIQFNLVDLTRAQAAVFSAACTEQGLPVSIFGLDSKNARVFWNWQFLDDLPDLPQTKAMLQSACDLRLPANVSEQDIEKIGEIILTSVETASNAKVAA